MSRDFAWCVASSDVTVTLIQPLRREKRMHPNNKLLNMFGLAVRRFRRRSTSRSVAGRPPARGLRIEPLESRQLLSISTIAESWKTLSGTLTGTYSGTTAVDPYYADSFPNCNFQETISLVYQDNLSTASGSSVSTDPAHNNGAGANSSTVPPPLGPETGPYTFTFSGSSTLSENNGQFQRTPGNTTVMTRTPSSSVGGGTPYDIGISGSLVPSGGNPAAMMVSGSWSADYVVAGQPAHTTGTYQGTLLQSGVFDAAVTAASWNPNGPLQFTVQSTGPSVPVAAANRNVNVASVALYWADAQGNHLASALPPADTVGLDWNQAGGTYQETDVSYKTPYPGASQLLIVINEGNAIPGFTEANTANNVFALALTPPTILPTTCGVYDPAASQFHLSSQNDWGGVAAPFGYGAPYWSPVAGDWNGDGRDTIGLFDPSSNQFYLRNSNDTGGSDVSFGYGIPNSGQVVVMGDWNGDGVETAGIFTPKASSFELRNSAGGGLSEIFFGFGAPGTDAFFDPKVAATSGANAQAVAAGDFNADGNMDVVAANSASNNVALMFGDGRGVMGAATTYTTGGTTPQALVAADFNGDGFLDLAVSNRDGNTIGVLLGGASGFAAATTYSTGGAAPYGVVAGDFNGDGKVDLAAANRASANVAVLLGNGAGAFAAAATFATGGTAPEILAKADFNGDGKLDLAVTNSSSNNVAVLLGNGAGQFGAAAAFSSGAAAPKGLATADFNRDGKLDIAVANSNAAVGVGILLGNGSGGFAAPSMYSSGAANPSALVAHDFNGDGITDLAALNGGANVTVMYGAIDAASGPGNFYIPSVKTFSSGGTPSWLTTADFSGDGKIDLAVANNDATASVGVLLNYRWEPVVGDWDGDGRDTVGLFDPMTGMFYLRNSLTTGIADVAFPYGAPQSGWQPLIGDWNGDGLDSAGFYIFNANFFMLRDSFTAGLADYSFAMGEAYRGWRPVVGNWAGLALQAAGSESASLAPRPSSLAPLSSPQALAPLLSAAIARWAAAGANIASPQVVVTDLPGAELGRAVGNTIYLDQDAAGHGWFVDTTPASDEEFSLSARDAQLRAVAPAAVDRIDLLTVVEHELGHIAGLDDLVASSGGLMEGRLEPGVRRLPETREVTAALS